MRCYDLSNAHNEKWEQNFSLLQEFYAEHVMFPKQKYVYNGVKLGMWCANQRRDIASGKCPPERYAKLYKIGFLQCNTHDVNWDLNFQKLMQFLDEYGRFPVEREWYHDFPIGKWCSNQKLQAKQAEYPKERYNRLNRIGFFDTTQNAKWEHHFQLLCEFVEENHRLPTRSEKYRDFNIGNWCTEQKRKALYHETYPIYRIEKLKTIGLLELDDTIFTWDRSYKLLEEYVKENKKFPVGKEKYKNYNLGNWCEAQKFLSKEPAYPADRLQKLQEIGLFSTTVDAKWNRHYELLLEFVAEHGRLPKQKELYRGEQIGVWCAMQKQRGKKTQYPAERVQKLTEIGLLK